MQVTPEGSLFTTDSSPFLTLLTFLAFLCGSGPAHQHRLTSSNRIFFCGFSTSREEEEEVRVKITELTLGPLLSIHFVWTTDQKFRSDQISQQWCWRHITVIWLLFSAMCNLTCYYIQTSNQIKVHSSHTDWWNLRCTSKQSEHAPNLISQQHRCRDVTHNFLE